MSLQVTFQICSIRKTLLTLKTFERLLSSVSSYVRLKALFNCETLSTLRAGVRLLSSVNFQMNIKV